MALPTNPPSDVQAADPLAAAAGASSRGSAWNSAGTWEEKDLSTWAQDALSAQLKGLKASATPTAEAMQELVQGFALAEAAATPTAEANTEADAEVAGAAGGAGAAGAAGAAAAELAEALSPLLLEVTAVKKCEGSASVQSSRGKVKHTFDLQFEIEWQATLQPAAALQPAATLQPAAALGADLVVVEGEVVVESAPPEKPAAKCKGSLSYAEVTS